MFISGVVSGVTILLTHIRGLITPLITTHEPPVGSTVYSSLERRAYRVEGFGVRSAGK